MPYLDTLIAILLAYLFGSISTAIVVCKLMGLPDPRTQGSGNPGATNVLRMGGKKAALITLLGDTLKGVIPVLVAKLYGFETLSLSLIAFAAFMGHLYPIFFQFKGGKGVATAFGAIFTLVWIVGLFLLTTWIAVAFFTRYSSLAALVTTVLCPIYMWFVTGNIHYTLMAVAMAIFLIYRHQKNIQNLYRGKESKIGKK